MLTSIYTINPRFVLFGRTSDESLICHDCPTALLSLHEVNITMSWFIKYLFDFLYVVKLNEQFEDKHL